MWNLVFSMGIAVRLRTQLTGVRLTMVLAIAFATIVFATHSIAEAQESGGQGSRDKGTGACATPASSGKSSKTKSAPYTRPAFHPPSYNQTDELKLDEAPGNPKESKLESPIENKSDNPMAPADARLPKLNPLENSVPAINGLELNSPGVSANMDSEMPLPGPAAIAPEGRQYSQNFELPPPRDFTGHGFNFSDAGCESHRCGSPLLPLQKFEKNRKSYDQQSAAALWPDCTSECETSWGTPSTGIGTEYQNAGTGISIRSPNRIENAGIAPGLLPADSSGAVSTVSSGKNAPPSQLPESRLNSATEVQAVQNSGIIIHPPMLQPFNRHQHTFIIENRGRADAEDVVIEITVADKNRIIAALPENSVTTNKVSLFKFPKIVSGESIPVHITAISNDNSPIEFSASLISRAVFSFHIQEGQQQGKLTKVSYLNKQSQSASPSSTTNGPVRVTNPFFRNTPALRPSQSKKSSQAKRPTASRRKR